MLPASSFGLLSCYYEVFSIDFSLNLSASEALISEIFPGAFGSDYDIPETLFEIPAGALAAIFPLIPPSIAGILPYLFRI